MERKDTKNIVIRAVSYAAAMLFAATAGFVFAKNGVASAAEQIERQPMISSEATKEYEAGNIDRETAITRISTRLDKLTNESYIKGWNFNEGTGEFNVMMSNGAVFTYPLD